MGEHTPGPWEAKRSAGADHWVVYGGGEPLADVVTWSDEVDEADACLIAAAPDLLEALKAVEWGGVTLDDFGDEVSGCPYCDAMEQSGEHMEGCLLRAAIARTEATDTGEEA